MGPPLSHQIALFLPNTVKTYGLGHFFILIIICRPCSLTHFTDVLEVSPDGPEVALFGFTSTELILFSEMFIWSQQNRGPAFGPSPLGMGHRALWPQVLTVYQDPRPFGLMGSSL